MAIQHDIISPLKSVLEKAETVFVMLPQNAGTEHIAAGLGLFHTLSSIGKNVTIATPNKLSQSAMALPGSDQVTNSIGNRNLVITLKVENRESIDKVSYNLDEEAKVFNLIIQPKKGHLPLKQSDVNYTYSGAQADILFIVGANRLEDLNPFYQEERTLFTDAKMVAINRFDGTAFADFHISDQTVSGNSELTYQLIKALDLSLNPLSANSLLAGIDQATNRLQSPTLKADTFEAVAQLLRAGGSRTAGVPVNQTTAMPSTPTSPTPNNSVVAQQTQSVTDSTNQVPDEWLQPKIFKGVPGQSK